MFEHTLVSLKGFNFMSVALWHLRVNGYQATLQLDYANEASLAMMELLGELGSPVWIT